MGRGGEDWLAMLLEHQQRVEELLWCNLGDELFPSHASLLELLQGDVEVKRLIAVIERQSHESMLPLCVHDLDHEVAAAVRDALNRTVFHFAHGEKFTVPSMKGTINNENGRENTKRGYTGFA